jgi:hypothetical protein
MKSSRPLVVTLLGAAIAALLLLATSCAAGSGSTGSAGPTVKVTFDSPTTCAIIINGKDVGVTPVDVAIDIDEATGFLKFDLAVTFDSSKTMGSRGAASRALGNSGPSTASSLSWVTGKHLPAKVTMINGTITESRDYAQANPPGTKSMVERDY